ncbi:beta propeller repeat protein [Pseudomonas ogarae]|nr:hypothetical protein [Pseudomonas ogarae]AEV63484.1 bnr domain-containing protein [Pseudomonas ogarae]
MLPFVVPAQQLMDEGPDKPLFDLFFLDVRNCGWWGPMAFVTHDGGLSWQSICAHVDNPNGLQLYGISQTGTDVFMAGEQGTLLRSSDTCQTFEALTPPF